MITQPLTTCGIAAMMLLACGSEISGSLGPGEQLPNDASEPLSPETEPAPPPGEAPACLSVLPPTVYFGLVPAGESVTREVKLRACEGRPLDILQATLGGQSAYAFEVELGLEWLPARLEPGEEVTLRIAFTADGHQEEAGDGTRDAVLQLVTNTPEMKVSILLRGHVQLAPVPVQVLEGPQVIPQTKLHLTAKVLLEMLGEPLDVKWSVVQPDMSASVFLPSAMAPEVTFEVNVAGDYTFALAYRQGGGEWVPYWTYLVEVIPDEAIHVELLWYTPNDPDRTDEGPEVGSDLDLHFQHPFSTGLDVDGDGVPDGWFDNPFDCFWFNPAPDWGSHDLVVDDDPGLDRDDTDGAGPENINLNIARPGADYRVGVHYWNDHGWGDSQASVRIYIHGVLTWSIERVLLENHDMWEVADISWPSGTVTPITYPDGSLRIISGYEHPLFLGQ